MTEQPKKTRDIKDLKARLGKPGATLSGQPPGSPQGVPTPPPGPGLPPSMGGPAAVPAPIGLAPMPAPFNTRSDAPPALPPADPFAKPATGALGPRSSPPAGFGRAQSIDPFAAATAVAPAQEIRLVIDEKPVADSEVGRKTRSTQLVIAAIAAVLGLAIGWLVGGTASDRALYKAALSDAKDIYSAASGAAPAVEKAQQLLDQAVRSAANSPAVIDTKALEELRKLEKPFGANVFSRKLYRAYESATVDNLFAYYNNVNLLWAKLQTLANRGLNPSARAQLEASATAAGLNYGCIPFSEGEVFGCGLVTVASEDQGKVKITARGSSYEKLRFSGQDLKAKPSDYILLVDRSRSGEALSGSTGLFQAYTRDLIEAKALAEQTVQIQGALIQALGAIAKNQ